MADYKYRIMQSNTNMGITHVRFKLPEVIWYSALQACAFQAKMMEITASYCHDIDERIFEVLLF